MKTRTGPIAYLQYLALRFAGLFLQMFPIDWNLRTARLFGTLFWRFSPRHRKRAAEHLRAAYPATLSDEQIDAMVRKSFQHWSMYVIEFLCAFRLLNEWTWGRYIDPVGMREPLDLMLDGGGAILLTGHYGNFELTAYMLSSIGFDTVVVMRPLDNKYLNDYVVRTRARCGLRLINKAGVTTEAEDILKRGGTIGFVADQDAGRKGVFVNFFGRKASTYKSIALLAIQCEVPILVGYARRRGDRFQYEARVPRIIRPDEWRDRDDPIHWITQEYTTAIESFVREVPEQYLWLHRRWKSRPRDRKGRAIERSSTA